jgi:pimeloyl-ACP methyl ester carboxylesterase
MLPHDLTAAGRRVRVFTHGEGRPLVLLHGGIGDALAHFSPIAPLLGDSFRLLAPALPSYEGSDPLPAPSWDALVEWLDGVFDALSLPRAVVLGNSFGAALARAFAFRHPARVEHLVLVNGGLIPRIPAPMRALSRGPLAGAISTLMRAAMYSRRGLSSMIATPAVLTDEFVDRARALAPRFSSLMLAVGAAGEPELGPVDVPVNLIWGMADASTPVVDAHTLAGEYVRADVRALYGVGHMPQIEDPARFVDTLKTALGGG